MKSSAGRKGFTLLELLIVIAIIGVLASLVYGIAASVLKRRQGVLALAQVKAIEEAAKHYYQDFGFYPPDTDSYEPDDLLPQGLSASEAKYSIMRYLGIKLVDEKSGAVHGPYLDVNPKFLKGDAISVDGRMVQFFCDPWGNPFEMDCMHVKIDKATKKYSKPSFPYPAGTLEEKALLEVKVWSKGPDGKSSIQAPFFPDGSAPEDDDNVMTWSNGTKPK